jgi:hypothetical protein
MKPNKISSGLITLLLLLGAIPASATSINLNVDGTLGPLLAGTDPLNLSGKDFSVTGTFDSSLAPVSTTSDSATYNLPVDLTIMVGALPFNGYGATMTVTAPPSGADTISLAFSVLQGIINPQVFATVSLPSGTLSGTALQDFSATISQPDSFLEYQDIGNSAVVSGELGVSGTAQLSAGGGPSVPEPGTLGLLATGLGIVAGRFMRQRGRRQSA